MLIYYRPARQCETFPKTLTFNCFIKTSELTGVGAVRGGGPRVCVFTECQYLQFVSISLIVPNYRPATVLLQYNTKTSEELHSNHQAFSSRHTGNMTSTLDTAATDCLSRSCRSPRIPRSSPSSGPPGWRGPGGRHSSRATDISAPPPASSPRMSGRTPTLCCIFSAAEFSRI